MLSRLKTLHLLFKDVVFIFLMVVGLSYFSSQFSTLYMSRLRTVYLFLQI